MNNVAAAVQDVLSENCVQSVVMTGLKLCLCIILYCIYIAYTVWAFMGILTINENKLTHFHYFSDHRI